MKEAGVNIGIEDIEGNMEHPIEEANVHMDVNKEWNFWEHINIKENMDHPSKEVGVEIDEKKEWNKTPDIVEKVEEDKTVVDMGWQSSFSPCLLLTSLPRILLLRENVDGGGWVCGIE